MIFDKAPKALNLKVSQGIHFRRNYFVSFLIHRNKKTDYGFLFSADSTL